MLVLDLETRSKCPLPEAGAYKYAADLSTEILCIGWGWSDTAETGVVDHEDHLPEAVQRYIYEGGLVAAFNSQFDRLVWNAVTGWEIPLEQWYCVAAQMRVNAMPTNLGDATKALFGKYRKDTRGTYLIRMLSLPQADGMFNEDPLLLREMREYCEQDIRATIDVMNNTRTMTPLEFTDFLTNEAINDRGMEVDLLLADLAREYAGAESEDIARRLSEITEGHITSHTQVKRLTEWLLPQLSPEAASLTTVYKKGEKKTSLDKNVRARLLAAADEGAVEMPGAALECLELLDDGNKSSVSKFARMVERAQDDGRVRGAFVFAGASQTLRYASRGLQLHNFRRDAFSPDEAEGIIDTMDAGEPLDDVMNTLSKLLRPALVPADGNVFVVGDWSSIEARALPWLAKDPRAQHRLDLFAAGEDVYQLTTDQLKLGDRQIGKVAELSLGYGGAEGAFQAMARNYGLFMPSAQVQVIVQKWRTANPWAVAFWNALEAAAMKAMQRPGEPATAGRVSYTYYPALIDGTLVCTLPGEHLIQYPRAKCETQDSPYGPRTVITALKANWKPAAGETEWPRVTLWRGLLAENVTQAVCACLLRHALREAAESDLPTVGHVHDEVIAEVPWAERQEALNELQYIMETAPAWAEGLPLAAEPKIMVRYGK